MMPDKSPATHSRSSGRWAGIVSGGVFFAFILLGVAVYLTPLKSWLGDGRGLRDHLAGFGLGSPLAFVAASAVLTAVGAPRLLLCSAGGMAFGFAWGLAWTQLGTLLGSYSTFLLARGLGRGFALSRFPKLRAFSTGLESRGLLTVLVVRQMPLNSFYNNVLLGLTQVGHLDFLLGSLIGFLPLGATACLLGAGLIQDDLAKGVHYLALALGLSVILGWVLRGWAGSRKNRRAEDQEVELSP